MFLDSQIEYLLYLQNLRESLNGFFDPFFMSVTNFGEYLISFAFLSFIYWSINKKAGEFLILTHAFSILINIFVKMLAGINRPWILSDKIKPVAEAIPGASGYSFPSGHTAKAMAIWGGLAVWLWDKKLVRYSMLILILLIAFSRNYLGVHTPQDVIFSLVAGVFILFFANRIKIKAEEDNTVCKKVFYAGVISSVVILGVVLFKYYNLSGQNFFDYAYQMPSFYFNFGYAFGVIAGWFACKTFITYETDNISWAKRISRFVFGFLILLIIMYQISPVLIADFGSCKGNLISAFVLGIFLTFFYPWIFTRVERHFNFKGFERLLKRD